jgi:DNA-binding IclR family transcriptional regulator
MSANPNVTAHTIPMVNKTFQLIRLISEDNEETTTKSLAICLGMSRSSCYRILRSLVAQDWIRPVAGGRHELSLGLLPVLQSLRRFETLVEAFDPVIRSLALKTQMTVKVTVRQGDDAVTISRSESPRGTSVGVRVGAAFPLAYGSSGAVLLSDLPDDQITGILGRAQDVCWERQTRKDVSRRVHEVRSKGWCADFGMYCSKCHALSAAIHDPQGRVVAALTVIGFSDEMTNESPLELSTAVAAAARQAEEALSNGWAGREATHATKPLQSLSRRVNRL